MRILYVSPGYKPAHMHGGPIISIASAAEELVRKGHRLVVFSTNSNVDEDLDVPTDQPIDVDGVEVWYFRRKEYLKRWLPFVPYLSLSMGFHYAPKMAKELEQIIPEMDLVHSHLPFVYTTYVAAKAAKHGRKPLFYSQRGAFDPARLKFREIKKRLYIRLIECKCASLANTLIALTEAEVRSYRALGMKAPCRIIPNGINVKSYRERPALSLPDAWNIDPETRVILFLGRLHKIKGADKLIRAFSHVHHLFRSTLIIAGPDEFRLKRQLQKLTNELGLEKKVIFPGVITGEFKLDILARADLFCLPSAAEGFSMAILESLASATPVLISPGCNFPKVENAGAGRIVSPKSECLASALSDLLAFPEALKHMGELGRQFVSRYYSWDRITDQLLDVYREGIERHKNIIE